MAKTQKKENLITSPAPLQEPKITWISMFDSFAVYSRRSTINSSLALQSCQYTCLICALFRIYSWHYFPFCVSTKIVRWISYCCHVVIHFSCFTWSPVGKLIKTSQKVLLYRMSTHGKLQSWLRPVTFLQNIFYMVNIKFKISREFIFDPVVYLPVGCLTALSTAWIIWVNNKLERV